MARGIALSSVSEKLTNFRHFSQREIKVSPQSDGRGIILYLTSTEYFVDIAILFDA
jgi:hypothetical protein